MELFGLAITFFSLVIAWQTYQNGKFMKGEMKAVRELLAKMDEHLVKMDERTAKLLEKIEERTAKISEQIERIPEKTAILLK